MDNRRVVAYRDFKTLTTNVCLAPVYMKFYYF